jgi:hypothetical protein
MTIETMSHLGADIGDYEPESELVDIAAIKASSKYKIKRYPDALYFGEVEAGKRNGLGVMKYKNSRVYEGNWAHDLRSGKGYEKYPNRNIYCGDF